MKKLIIMLLVGLISTLLVISCDQSDKGTSAAPDEISDQLNDIDNTSDSTDLPPGTDHDPQDSVYVPPDSTSGPSIIHAYPGGNGTDPSCFASVNTPILVSFSESIDPATVTPETFDVSGAEGTLHVCGNTILFTPTDAFYPGVMVEVTVSKDILDFDGEGMLADFTFDFNIQFEPGQYDPE